VYNGPFKDGSSSSLCGEVMSKFNVDLSKEIERLTQGGQTDIIDAVCHFCSENNLDVETVAALIKKDAVLRAKVQIEAENLNILKPSAKLPIDV
jgi:hypothetical protein